MRLTTRLLLASILVLDACGGERPQPRSVRSELGWHAEFPDSTGWMTWAGYHLSFQTPPGATITPDTSRFSGLSGAQISAFVGGGDVPDFRVHVSAIAVRDDRPLQTWLDSVRARRNGVLDRELAQLGPARPRKVGALAGLRLIPFCGDCEASEVYVQTDSMRVGFEYSLESGSLINRAQQDSLYERMLASVRRR